MANKQTTSKSETRPRVGLDLHLELQGTGLRVGLSDALREAVRSGRLAPGTRLPGSRALAEDLGVARSTVTECYAALVEEGWLIARHGSGTHVAQRAAPQRTPELAPFQSGRRPHGLEPGAAEYADFPRAPWLAAARKALSGAPHTAFGYGDSLGRIELRIALADYLSRVRGVQADPANIVITSGFHHGLAVLARALKSQGVNTVAVESYGLGIYRDLLEDEGMAIPALEVDESGAGLAGLEELQPGSAALLTPAHQFPTGHALSPDRRHGFLEWARRTGGVVLEDDYDGEFRYDRKPVGALQGLDPDHVVYFGTASKSVAPALRLAWAVIPERLLPAVTIAKGRVDTVSVLDQLIFTEFVSSGGFDRHVRSRRHSNRSRREQLVATLAEQAPDVRVLGMPAGLQAALLLPEGTEALTFQAAARQGLAVSGLSQFRHPQVARKSRWSDGLVVNFSAVSDSSWPSVLQTLASVMP
ncbi:GntR family transcriptional regulator [Cryobacterium zongtaii]|uniref:GntR family transcriptional regulator n=1 Tax=Cryobacterium zongtaii TaxID=1259217 RepID=A0A2S3ZDJ8_9MICO|nr:PLP-dependent aminotransferase family protein [Cryobacterium zongtaii]POH64400.1 GntR family transcriptional regulator [Cryobacterium zongtaii]